MASIFDIKFLSHGRKAVCPPDPKYPDGMIADVAGNATKKCSVNIPYPAECVGAWLIRCKDCGRKVGITAAGRRDDPKAVVVDCNKRQKS